MSFHDVQFPSALSFGSSGGPERRTEIVTLASGFEERNATWAHARRRYDAGLGLRSLNDVHEVVAFFEARLGMLYAFRWRDWADWKSCPPSESPGPFDQALGTGDGTRTTFALKKDYASGPSVYARPISKPRSGTVSVALDGVEQNSGSDFAVDADGAVAFNAAPPAGAAVTAGFEFDVPVRFDTDRIEINLAAFEAGEIPSIPIIEVRV